MTITGFEPFANATLSFSTSGNTTSVDSETGNVIPIVVTTTYTAYLSQKKLPTYLAEDGIDSTAIYLEGQLISPWSEGARLFPNSVAEATFQGVAGKFELLPQEKLIPRYKSWLGTPIRGIFKAYGPA